MLHGIGWQVWDPKTNRAFQTIFIPAAWMAYERFVDAVHSRQPWTRRIISDMDLFGGTDRLLAHSWADNWNRVVGTRHLVGDPTVFQITDEEYLAIREKRDVIHRNIPLRFQRGLIAQSQAIFGNGRKNQLSDALARRGMVAGSVVAGCGGGDGSGISTYDGVELTLNWLFGLVRDQNWAELDRLTAPEARARQAGPARNGDNLPVPLPTPPAVPAQLLEPGQNDPAPRRPRTVAPVPEQVAAADLPPVSPGEEVVRSHGQVYLARRLVLDEVISDVQFYRNAYAAGHSIFNFGPPGTGKTAGYDAAFPGMITMVGTDSTVADDFIGGYVATGQDSFAWVDGPLLVAMEKGVPLYVDEIGQIDPRVLPVIFPLMDGRNEILVTANPLRGVVVARPGFGIIGSTNPYAPGTRLSEALLSRFSIHLEVGTDYNAARKLGVNARLVEAAEHLQTKVGTGEASWAPEMRDCLRFRDMEATFGLISAIRNLINHSPDTERDQVATHLRERFGDVVSVARKCTGLKLD